MNRKLRIVDFIELVAETLEVRSRRRRSGGESEVVEEEREKRKKGEGAPESVAASR